MRTCEHIAGALLTEMRPWTNCCTSGKRSLRTEPEMSMRKPTSSSPSQSEAGNHVGRRRHAVLKRSTEMQCQHTCRAQISAPGVMSNGT